MGDPSAGWHGGDVCSPARRGQRPTCLAYWRGGGDSSPERCGEWPTQHFLTPTLPHLPGSGASPVGAGSCHHGTEQLHLLLTPQLEAEDRSGGSTARRLGRPRRPRSGRRQDDATRGLPLPRLSLSATVTRRPPGPRRSRAWEGERVDAGGRISVALLLPRGHSQICTPADLGERSLLP
jgi:hypothetical protein